MLQKQDFPEALPGFAGINRFWDHRHHNISAKILPGEYYVTPHDETIATVLGSCVSACVRDPFLGIGAMNHFLLPLQHDESWTEEGSLNSVSTRYGNYAMEHMINDLIKFGGQKKNLEFKIFGGSQIISNMGNVGSSNIKFVLNYLNVEGFSIAAKDLGGNNPRKVVYFPQSGRVLVKKIKDLHNDTIIQREQEYMHNLDQPEAVTGEIELFD